MYIIYYTIIIKTKHFVFIVEGANLFFTEEARLFLEKHGVIIFKDASANKGGVTSSSLEVLSALAMTDKQFEEHMCYRNNKEPPFYNQYVQEVIHIIETNARLEFDCIWKEHEKNHTPRTLLTNQISHKINSLHTQIIESKLWLNESLRKQVILNAIPPSLIKLVGENQLFSKVPINYLKAIFGSHLASYFVYQYGLNTSEFAFMDFLNQYGLNILENNPTIDNNYLHQIKEVDEDNKLENNNDDNNKNKLKTKLSKSPPPKQSLSKLKPSDKNKNTSQVKRSKSPQHK